MPINVGAHVFKSPAFKSVVDDAIAFFGTTEDLPLSPLEFFGGTGVYGIYYTGTHSYYSKLTLPPYAKPLYIGKAVAKGSRQGTVLAQSNQSVFGRLSEHAASIASTSELDVKDFRCRFTIFEGEERDLIVPVESHLIRYYTPIWNSIIKGFGNHDPGSGRYNQMPSEWDTLHPGRYWASRLTGTPRNRQEIEARIILYLNGLT